MNKSTRICASLFFIVFFLLFSPNIVRAAEQTGFITFGQLMDGSYEKIKEEKQKQKELAEGAKIKDLLAKLEQAYNDSVNNNPIVNETPLEHSFVNDNQIADNAQYLPITNISQLATQTPAPTMSQSALIANINDYLNNQTISPSRFAESDSASRDKQPTTNNLSSSGLGEPKKSWFTVALLGDSMTDTLQPDLPQLNAKLKEAYPDYTFRLYNYGQGATDLESGLFRLTNTTNYLGKEFPPLLSYHPDILVVESFAYNPWSWEMHDLDRQWLTIAHIIDAVKTNSPQTRIILASTIAPNTKIFGDGALNWNTEGKWKKATTIKLYLQNMVNFATSQNYPLADAYHASLDGMGEGMGKYINGGDNLHPSGEGGMLYAQKIVETIKANNFIQ